MKKIILLAVIFIMFTRYSQCQTFEHQYSGLASIFKTDVNEYVYGVSLSGGTQYNIYSMNHTLIKTINLSTAASGIINLSKILFNTDNKYELTYQYSGGVKIVNEDDVALLDEVGAGYASFFNTDQGAKMLTVFYSPAKTNVYSLVGQVLSVPKNGDDIIEVSSFPNPANNNITISYSIPVGFFEGDLVIYNVIGAEIKRYKVDRHFNNVHINTSEFSSGTYFYKIISNNVESQTNKFIIE